MAVIKAINSKASIGKAIDYVTKDEKTEEKLISGFNCTAKTREEFKEQMQLTKEMWNKTGGRTYKHFGQSFAPGEDITTEKAHEIACKLMEKVPWLQKYEVLIATHKDKEHIHTHFIVNSVSFEDGYKLQQSNADLQKMKDLSDELCREYGLTITEKGKTWDGQDRDGELTAWSKEKYQWLKKAEEEWIEENIKRKYQYLVSHTPDGEEVPPLAKLIDTIYQMATGNDSLFLDFHGMMELQQEREKLEKKAAVKSYVLEAGLAANRCKEISTSKDDFIANMKTCGFDTEWSDTRKHITFTHIERRDAGEKKCKVRGSNLEKTFNIKMGKEDLISEFEKNKSAAEQLRADNERRAERQRAAEEQLGRFNHPANGEDHGTGEPAAGKLGDDIRTELDDTKAILDYLRSAERAARSAEAAREDKESQRKTRNEERERLDRAAKERAATRKQRTTSKTQHSR